MGRDLDARAELVGDRDDQRQLRARPLGFPSGRDNIVTTSIPSAASNQSTEPRNLDVSDAPGRIYATLIRFRSVWR